MSNPTIDKTVRASSQVLDVALDALRDANEWGIGEQIQGMVFRDVKVRITGSKFVVDAETSGWRYLPGSFPGLGRKWLAERSPGRDPRFRPAKPIGELRLTLRAAQADVSKDIRKLARNPEVKRITAERSR